MRKDVITSSGIGVTLPDVHAWTGDRNTIEFKDENTQPHTGFRVSIGVVGSSRLINAETDRTLLVVDISDLLYVQGYDISQSIHISVNVAGATYQNNWPIYIHRGKTIVSRVHGSARVIEVAEIGDPVKLYFGGERCSAVDGSSTLISNAGAGIHSLNIPTTPSGNIVVKQKGYTIGEVYSLLPLDPDGFVTYEVRYITRCVDGRALLLHYYDTDGVERVANGKVQTDQTTIKQNEYGVRDDVINNSPRRKITSTDEVLQVGFADVDPLQYLEDIMLSERVWFSYAIGDTTIERDVVPKTLTMTRDYTTQDIVITFKILA